MVRKHMYISGRVQGVGFRYSAYYAAQSLGLTGWVRNLDDGRVELQIQGEDYVIDRMISQLDRGRFIRIDQIEEEEIPTEKETDFSVRG